MSYFGIFMFEVGTLTFVEMQCFVQNKRTSNLGPNVPYLVGFWPVILKTVVLSDISTLEFVKMQSFIAKLNS